MCLLLCESKNPLIRDNFSDDLQGKPNAACAVCYNTFSDDDAFCLTCSYPLKGTKMEQETFIIARNNKEIDLAEHDKKIKTALNYLKFIGGYTLFSGLVLYSLNKTEAFRTEALLTNIVLAAVYFSLGFWKKRPMAAIITGFSLYLIVIVASLIYEPVSIGRGIFLKIIIILAFINGIKSIREADKIKSELAY